MVKSDFFFLMLLHENVHHMHKLFNNFHAVYYSFYLLEGKICQRNSIGLIDTLLQVLHP